MKQLTLDQVDEYLDVRPNKHELGMLSAHTPKQKEMYFMRKFIDRYKFLAGRSQTQCLEMMNEQLVKQGFMEYPKKHVSAVNRLWHKPFVSLEI